MKSTGILTGFLYFFGFINNPYGDAIRKMHTRSDFDALKSDWQTVGQDFSKIIKEEKPVLDACK